MSVKNVNNINRMSATHFITGETPKGKNKGALALLAGGSILALSRALRLANFSKMAEGGMIRTPIQLLPAIPLKKPFNMITGSKAYADMNGIQKFASRAKDVIDMPGDAMQTPMAAFRATGDTSVAGRLGSTGAAKKIFGDDAAQKMEQVASKRLGFTGAITNALGSIFGGIEKQFGMTDRIDAKIAKKQAESEKLREAAGSFENVKSGTQKTKEKLGFQEKDMAADAAVQKKLTRAQKRLWAAVQREKNYNALPAMVKEERRVAYNNMLKERKQRLDGLLEGVEGKEDRANIIAEFNTKFTKEERKIANAHGVQRNVKETEARVNASLAELDGDVSKKALKNLRDYKNNEKDIAALEDKKELYKNPKEAIKHRLENLTMSDVADFTLRYGAVAQETIVAVKGANMERRMAKQLIADVKGINPQKISNGKLRWMAVKALFGGLKDENPVIRDAMRQYAKGMLATYVPLGLGIVGQEVVSQKLAKKYGEKNPLVSIGISMGLPMLRNATSSIKGSMLETYASFRMAQEAGDVQLSGNEYAQLLTNSSKMIRDMGGMSNYKAILMAQYYALNQTPVEQVMKDLSKGKEHMLKIADEGAVMVEQHKKEEAAHTEAQQQQQQVQGNAVTDSGQGFGAVGAGFFTGQSRNQPASQGTSFTERVASAPTGQGAGMGAGG